MKVRILPPLMLLASAGAAVGQVPPIGPVPGVPTKDILSGTLEQGRQPMLSLCDRVRQWHADRVFILARKDRSVAGRTLLVVNPTAGDAAALRGEGFEIDDGAGDPGECRLVRACLERPATLGELDELFARIAPNAAWAPLRD